MLVYYTYPLLCLGTLAYGLRQPAVWWALATFAVALPPPLAVFEVRRRFDQRKKSQKKALRELNRADPKSNEYKNAVYRAFRLFDIDGSGAIDAGSTSAPPRKRHRSTKSTRSSRAVGTCNVSRSVALVHRRSLTSKASMRNAASVFQGAKARKSGRGARPPHAP